MYLKPSSVSTLWSSSCLGQEGRRKCTYRKIQDKGWVAFLYSARSHTFLFKSFIHTCTQWKCSTLTSRQAWDFSPLSDWCKSCLIFSLCEPSSLKLALPTSLKAGNQVSQVRPWNWSHPKHPKIFITFSLSTSTPVELQQNTNRAVSNTFC